MLDLPNAAPDGDQNSRAREGVALDDARCRSIDDVHRLLDVERIGVPVRLHLLRRGRALQVTALLVELPME